MLIVRKIDEIRKALASKRRETPDITVGFVPTMGYLHDGHVSLIRQAKKNGNLVVLSIFVNPLQFGPNEDFDKYPRDEARDLAIAEQAGVDIVFLPSVEEMYPKASKTKVVVSEVTNRLCGASRPGHFDGVATVVTKLFQIVQPDQAYFGLKDAQQVAVIKQMTQDLNMPVEVVPCPILREPDGLAMSSRNVYLTPEQRKEALVLFRCLQEAKTRIQTGNRIPVQQLKEDMRREIMTSPQAEIDYLEILTYPGLEPIDTVCFGEGEAVIVALAVKFGATRLIDNVIISMGGKQ